MLRIASIVSLCVGFAIHLGCASLLKTRADVAAGFPVVRFYSDAERYAVTFNCYMWLARPQNGSETACKWKRSETGSTVHITAVAEIGDYVVGELPDEGYVFAPARLVQDRMRADKAVAQACSARFGTRQEFFDSLRNPYAFAGKCFHFSMVLALYRMVSANEGLVRLMSDPILLVFPQAFTGQYVVSPVLRGLGVRTLTNTYGARVEVPAYEVLRSE